MKRRKAIWLGCAVCSFALAGNSAFGADLMSFTYSDLSGSFDSNSLLFNATDTQVSAGDVTRLLSPGGDAVFAGTVAGNGFPSLAAVDLSLDISNITATTADASGMLTMTDVTGDTIIGSIQGTWDNVSGIAAVFTGTLSNILMSNSGDGTFDGNSGPGFSMNFPVTPPFDGAVVTLESGNWFGTAASPNDFSGATTLISGVIVPEPATLGLLALGAMAVAFNRRRHR